MGELLGDVTWRFPTGGPHLVAVTGRQVWIYEDRDGEALWPQGEPVAVTGDGLLHLAGTLIGAHGRLYPLRTDHAAQIIGRALREAPYKASGGRMHVVTLAR